ncbi:interleukin-31 receptor subunit alpha [Lepus europaeus]|uniref:interleukin-31 receptor subunit alpha n=1 Tax=Lepus europaeus TaxID=9983 RepID=UPI002B47F871|nr:interleukin-31 receptor subunit alpha [Lepus europaeus]
MMWTWALWMLPLLCRCSLAALPAKPENISCVYYYMKNLTCTWSPEREIKHTNYTVTRMYTYAKKKETCRTNSSASENQPSCSFFPPNVTNTDYFTVEVEAENAEGIVKSYVTEWHTDSIVKTEPPEILSVKPVLGVKRMVQVKWKAPALAPEPPNFSYRLRFWTVNSTSRKRLQFPSNDYAYNLTRLQASTEYVVNLQCAVGGSKFWSDLSREVRGVTEAEAPYGLELWRVLRPAEVDGKRPVRLLWKKARGAPVLEETLFYNIQYSPENNPNLTETENTTDQQLELRLGGETYRVAVMSYNSLGHSPEAKLRIPAIHEKPFRCIEGMQARLAQGLLVVEWQSCDLEVDAWMVEWVPDLDSERSTLSWESVSGAQKWTIQQDKLKPLWCYNISVYPVLQDEVGEPYSIQAYAKEGIPSKGPMTRVENIGLKTARITWKEIPKSERNGFINNYTIFYQAEDGREFSKTVNSSILQYDLESLTRKTSYAVWVMASTSAGGYNGTTLNFKTLSVNVLEIILITSLVGGGLLLLFILTVAYGLKKPNKLTHLCWPDVPNPAESSLATWHGHFKGERNLKELDDSVNTEDRILKSRSAPRDLIDKLVVNFENFLEDVSTGEAGKGWESIWAGEKNEYVTSPSRRDCLPGRSVEGALPSTEPLPTTPGGGCSEAPGQPLPSGPGLREGDTPTLYLKNSVTTREFLVSEALPDRTERQA